MLDLLVQCAVCGMVHLEDIDFDHAPKPLRCGKCGADILVIVPDYDPKTTYYCRECCGKHTYARQTVLVCTRCGDLL